MTTPNREKKVFALDTFKFLCGQTVSKVKIGYEAWGQLNKSGDNAILVCPHHLGNSHVSSSAQNPEKGYWSCFIGPDLAIDTNKHFVVSMDNFINACPSKPFVVTTGPASTNPETKKPYGMSFPIVTIRDQVKMQYQLLKSLGVQKLKCVMGASLGGFQTFQWVVDYPDFVSKAIPMVSSPRTLAWLIEFERMWIRPILDDPDWNGGDYYDKEKQPKRSVVRALGSMGIMCTTAEYVNSKYGRKFAKEDKDPCAGWENLYLVEQKYDSFAERHVKLFDANSLLYLWKLVVNHDISVKNDFKLAVNKIKSDILWMNTDTDLLFPVREMKKEFEIMKEILEKNGVGIEFHVLESGLGHLGVIYPSKKELVVITKKISQFI